MLPPHPPLIWLFWLNVDNNDRALTGMIVQEGFSRLWRGTNASLALAIPTVSVFFLQGLSVFPVGNLLYLVISVQVGIYLPCYDMLRNFLEELSEQHASSLSPYSPLVAGSAARMLACITCYPIELARTRMQVTSLSLIVFGTFCWLEFGMLLQTGRVKNMHHLCLCEMH